MKDDRTLVWALCMVAAIVCILIAALARAQAMPDPSLTPGAVDKSLTKEKLCDPKFHTGTVRNVPQREKRAVCVAYGIKSGCPGPNWELDHDVSIEIGGSNDPKNLWPQPIAEARRKDVLENRLHKEVCAGRMTLPDAQECIRANWIGCFRKVEGATPKESVKHR